MLIFNLFTSTGIYLLSKEKKKLISTMMRLGQKTLIQFSTWDISNVFQKRKEEKVKQCVSYTTFAMLPCPEEKQNRVILWHY